MRRTLGVLLLVFLAALPAFSQVVEVPTVPGWFNRNGRFSFGVQGGVNSWFNDFGDKDFTGGGEAILRYAADRYVSFGLMGGYEVLQSTNGDIQPSDYALRHSFLHLKGVSASLMTWFYLNAGKPVSPYLYVGVGGFWYKRSVENAQPWPEDKTYNTVHFPVGAGLEIAMSRHVTFTLDVGARIMDKNTDNINKEKSNVLGNDWYATGRAGLNVYFGTSDDDDSDADGLTNGYEKKIGTDPTKPDTDGDGLSDYEEVTKYRTDAVKADSDGDGLSDGDEVVKYLTAPLKTDSDGDGLNDGEEVTKYKSDPLKTDTDGDGLSDLDEVQKSFTDPLKSDTDGDGLPDGDEVSKFQTNPLKVDTDGGTVSDGQEIARKSNPLDPSDDVPKPVLKVEVGKAIVLEGIVFKSGKATIEPESEQILNQALLTFQENAALAVEIRGYTDNVGKIATNKKLSLQRANAVKSWLVMKGIDAGRITTAGYGPENPIATNATAEGRAMNRRIEFFRTK